MFIRILILQLSVYIVFKLYPTRKKIRDKILPDPMEGSKVYTPDERDSWVPATVQKIQDKVVSIVLQDGEHREVALDGELPLQNADVWATESGVEDMCLLSHLHEPAIAYNLRRRFQSSHPYTFTGNIVIAVNPYKWIPELYSDTLRRMYASKERSSLPPHVYATSARSFRNMAERHIPQSVLLSGESGSGKTETVKIMMEHLATVSGEGKARSSDEGLSSASIIEKVLKSNPLLESFGNAKTGRNDNSSRFGKFTQLQFDKENRMIGAKCRHYLLEKTRVVHQSVGERNFHVFYQLISSDDAQYQLHGKSVGDFTYLSDPDAAVIKGISDAEEYKNTCFALHTVGVSTDEQNALFAALSGILHLGQVLFEYSSQDNEDSAMPSNQEILKTTAELLGTTAEALGETLCNRTVRARQEIYSVPLNVQQAVNNRDALAKELYARLFSWLIRRVNSSISCEDRYLAGHIDLLDIFGFERFESNSFEQFCINFANEKLQQKFTSDVFKTVQQEYTSEGIEWSYISFQDNQDILDLFEGRMGLISLLNEECIRPKGSDASYASKVITAYDEHPRLCRDRLTQMNFTLQHYAGAVTYDCNSFVEKNKDALQSDLEDLLHTSSNALVCSVFQSTSTKSVKPRQGTSLMKETVSSKFKSQLTLLMNDISSTEVHYVRCLKPNETKSSNEFAMTAVVEQLRCGGIVEAIRISRAAFPNKMRHEQFLQRYVVLKSSSSTKGVVPMSARTASAACEQLANTLLPPKHENGTEVSPFIMGKTSIYFRAGAIEDLEKNRTTIVHERAIMLQKTARGWLCRLKYQDTRSQVVILQAWIRCMKQCQSYNVQRTGVIKFQAVWRGVMSRNFLDRLVQRRMAIRIQKIGRGRASRRMYQRQRDAAICIQSRIQMILQRSEYERLLADKREQRKMESQLELLNQRLEDERREREEIEARNTTLQQQLDASLSETQSSQRYSSTSAGIEDSRLLDESGKMLEYMRGEINKLREVNEQLRAENENTKSENKRVKDAYTAAGASFAALNQHNKQQSKANLRLMSTHAALIKSQEEKMKKYQKQIADLKEELRMQRNVYSAELMVRVQQQDLMMDIVHLAESHGVDEAIVSKMRHIAIESQTNQPSSNARRRRLSGPGIQGTSQLQQVSRSTVTVIESLPSPPSHPSDIRATIGPGAALPRNSSATHGENGFRDSWSSGAELDDEGRHRRSRIGGMFKKMFKKEDSQKQL